MGTVLLLAGVVSVWLVAVSPSFVLVSWALAGGGLAALARDPALLRPARAGLVALVAVVLLSLVGAGVTFGTRTRALVATPTFDPTVVLVSFGIVAAFWGAGAFVLVHERARRERLALVGAVLMGIGLVAFVWDALWRHGLASPPIVAGSGFHTMMVVGAMLLFAALARAAFRALRPVAA